MALRELAVENFRGIRFARLALEPTTLLVGENDCGASSLLEALALALSPFGPASPRIEPWQLHLGRERNRPTGPARVVVTLAETRPGSWDRPELEPLSRVLAPKMRGPRSLVLEIRAEPAGEAALETHWTIRSPGGRRCSDDALALGALRRLNPLVWLRGGMLVRPGASSQASGVAEVPGEAGLAPGAAPVVASLERLLGTGAAWSEGEIESGYQAAERLLAEWAPRAREGRLRPRATVAEILGRAFELSPAERPPEAPIGSSAHKLGVLLLTAGLFQALRGSRPGVRPTIVIEQPEAGLHPMTLASVWGLLERLATQKIVATHSGTLLSAAPLHSLRRLVRDGSGEVREWRVRAGALRPDELRKVGYHLRARRGAACFARCWLLVEGETEYWILPDLARVLGYDLAQEGVAVVEFAQCGLKPLLKLARELGIEWHVLVDGDRAGEAYAGLARDFAGGDPGPSRLTCLPERDIEHCFWSHGHARVFERLAGVASRSEAQPRRVIEKAIERRSKPGVAFELLAACAAAGPEALPPSLRSTVESCVALARRESRAESRS
jgi:putative ATP-dependent endonuclease of OLD family